MVIISLENLFIITGIKNYQFRFKKTKYTTSMTNFINKMSLNSAFS